MFLNESLTGYKEKVLDQLQNMSQERTTIPGKQIQIKAGPKDQIAAVNIPMSWYSNLINPCLQSCLIICFQVISCNNRYLPITRSSITSTLKCKNLIRSK